MLEKAIGVKIPQISTGGHVSSLGQVNLFQIPGILLFIFKYEALPTSILNITLRFQLCENY
jgi:hypothetical protein